MLYSIRQTDSDLENGNALASYTAVTFASRTRSCWQLASDAHERTTDATAAATTPIMPLVDRRRRIFEEIGGGEYGKDTFLVFGPSQGSEEHGWLLQTYDSHASTAHAIGHIQRRDFACVVLVNAVIFTIGGEVNGQATGLVDAYSLQSRRSFPVAPMKTERSYHGAAVSGDDIVVGGGFDVRGRLATCEAYMMSTNKWIHLPALSEARTSPGLAALADRQVFVIGGYNERDLAKVEYCQLPDRLSEDIISSPEFWREAAPLNIARCGLGVAVLRGRIIAAGGVASDAVEVFQPPNADNQRGQWTLISRMNQERYKFSLAAGQGYIFAFGSHQVPVNTVERLEPTGESLREDDITTWRWTSVSVPLVHRIEIEGALAVSESVLTNFLTYVYRREHGMLHCRVGSSSEY
ncbi:Kelch-like [Sparganum proliferum]